MDMLGWLIWPAIGLLLWAWHRWTGPTWDEWF
jgi:hypothetical protein